MPKRARHLGTSTYARRQREDISPTSFLHTHHVSFAPCACVLVRYQAALILHLSFFKSTGHSSSHLLSFASMVCTAHSTSPLDCPYSGDDVKCSNPHRAANSLNFFGCKLKTVVSDKGIAYTMSTKHFLHSQDGLSSIDTSRYKTDFNVA